MAFNLLIYLVSSDIEQC
uniref:Uncharacterized protein n=1 Tax=Anguilla anguilla TaxID=7936 RepID=A0A0E9PU86_ANGAN